MAPKTYQFRRREKKQRVNVINWFPVSCQEKENDKSSSSSLHMPATEAKDSDKASQSSRHLPIQEGKELDKQMSRLVSLIEEFARVLDDFQKESHDQGQDFDFVSKFKVVVDKLVEVVLHDVSSKAQPASPERDVEDMEGREHGATSVNPVPASLHSKDDSPSLPFTKTSPMWEMLLSMDVFRKMPQQPHFHPLKGHNEELREGMAIGIMVNFANLVGSVHKLNTANMEDAFKKKLEAFVYFENHGFDVGPVKEYMRVHTVILNRKKNSEKLQNTIDEKDKLIEELGKVMPTLSDRRTLNAKALEQKESEIVKLKEKFLCLKQLCTSSKCNFNNTNHQLC